MTDYEPGDVALVEYRGHRSVAIASLGSGTIWWSLVIPNGLIRIVHPSGGNLTVIRRLAVIDPENVEQVERLQRCYDTSLSMFEALDEYTSTPPTKPAEPMGLGAVVEDTDGEVWVRTPDPDEPWVSENGMADWGHIDVVEILEEGRVL